MNEESITQSPPYLTFHPDENGRVLDVTVGEGWTMTEAAQALIKAVEELLAKAKAQDDQQQG